MADRLSNEQFLLGLCDCEDAETIDKVLKEANLIAGQLLSGGPKPRADLLERILEEVNLQEDHITVRLEQAGLSQKLGIGGSAQAAEDLDFNIPAVRVRRGHQIRLVIPGDDPATSNPPKRDQKLVGLVAEAFDARRLVESTPSASIARLASDEGKCRTRFGMLVKLSCLAPDIVQSILEGKRPISLTARSLISCELPLSWKEQRKALGFS